MSPLNTGEMNHELTIVAAKEMHRLHISTFQKTPVNALQTHFRND